MKRWSRARRQENTNYTDSDFRKESADRYGNSVQGKETRANYANSDFREHKRAAYNIIIKAKRAASKDENSALGNKRKARYENKIAAGKKPRLKLLFCTLCQTCTV
jgi:hypothetical protein